MPASKPNQKGSKPPRIHFEWNIQNITFIIVVVIFVVIVFWSEPISQLFTHIEIQDQINVTPSPTLLPGTPTPLPLQYLTSADQTSGILLGVLVLAVIIIAGTLAVIYRHRS